MIGTSIGNYKIQRLIGEGGMGKVYLAEHPGIGRRAAVKVLTPSDASDPQIVSRFITEARAANAIRHPNIVDIYDSGVLEDGTPYIVMEYLEGEPLTHALLRGALALEDAIDYGCQVAEALAAAHVHDVVHRDLKPDNLFLVPDPRRLGKQQVKVLDFGIAKLQRRTLGQVHKTRTGSLLGTPLYMSPEQCMGTKDIDTRTDIYSLGVILYEMVTGKRPFDSDSVYAVISMHINDTPAPPSRRRADMPAGLETIILTALAKSPGSRQESMAQLHSQLELARGNSTASTEALLRAHQERARPITGQVDQAQRSPTDLRTLGETAVSQQVTRQGPQRRGWIKWVLLVSGLTGATVAGFVLLNPAGDKARPTNALSGQPSIAPVTPVQPAPVVAAPSSVELGLESQPAGAQIFIGDVLIGKTPTKYKATAGGEPLEFTFKLDGFEAEKIRALPAQGLTVTAKLNTIPPDKRTSSGKHKQASAGHATPSTDIQTER